MSTEEVSSRVEDLERQLIAKATLGGVTAADAENLRAAQERDGERNG